MDKHLLKLREQQTCQTIRRGSCQTQFVSFDNNLQVVALWRSATQFTLTYLLKKPEQLEFTGTTARFPQDLVVV